MKKQLLLYLFIIAALMTVFTYMYFSKKSASDKKKYDEIITRKTDSLNVLTNTLYDANYFALENNDNAQNYLENYDVAKLIPQVKEALLEYNTPREGNKYIDQPMMGEQKFIINKIKVLNHRWIIADYSNGQLWGEVLIKYFVNDDNTFTFETIETHLYPLQKTE